MSYRAINTEDLGKIISEYQIVEDWLLNANVSLYQAGLHGPRTGDPDVREHVIKIREQVQSLREKLKEAQRMAEDELHGRTS